MASYISYLSQQNHRQWLAKFDDNQVIQQANAGNLLFMEELFKRAKRLEFEGDLLMACQLYRQGYRYFKLE
ncbi:hypothetical protein FE810_13370 [Thalassotalea litorea]|uniref:Uncharacterized protein n=1 Tax=Thalassotalea litorea TaxID=2020715 RepID=A0A5R9IDX8_9GAMM|nr:hypothetical protein [Thalassotalea litorea]TLU61805.1 hypothetical protein FE810_13370 [Thalassotalea litorea]